MADIELVIKVPEDVFKRTVFNREFKDLSDCVTTLKALEKAVQLPKGHGRLIDLEEVRDRYVNIIKVSNSELENLRMLAEILDTSPTIIESDRSEEV